ncbi:MAG TPA: hypothetical protein VGH44_06205 [Candidatus Saccharimonadia bacterium]|jgi:hypothetical protein
MEPRTIITINQARQLLGEKAQNWSDAQVEEHIQQLDFIATLAINQLRSKTANDGGSSKVQDS